MLTKDQILSKLKELKPNLYIEYSVKEIGVFGSYVSGDASEDSDIDILIELDKPIGWKYFTLELYLEDKLGKKIDLVTKNALKDQIRNSILSQVNYA
jgi:predicted nucleotidyltransferase